MSPEREGELEADEGGDKCDGQHQELSEASLLRWERWGEKERQIQRDGERAKAREAGRERERDHNTGDLAYKSGDLAHKTGDLAHNTGDLTRKTGDLAHRTGDLAHKTGDLVHKTGDLAHT